MHDFVLGGQYAKLGSWRRGDGADERAVRYDALDACDVGDLGGRC
ncbi:MAG: hypothetical protein R3F34_18085 [Planctomycetota bacterium]